MTARRRPAFLLALTTLLIPAVALLFAYNQSPNPAAGKYLPQLSLSPLSGNPGTTVTIDGRDAPPAAVIELRVQPWNQGEDCRVAQAGQVVATVIADAEGRFATSQVVDRGSSAQAGVSFFARLPSDPVDRPSSNVACFRFDDSGPVGFRIALDPAHGPSGATVTISGAGAAPYGIVQLFAATWSGTTGCAIAGTAKPVAQVNADANGTFRATHQAVRVDANQLGTAYVAKQLGGGQSTTPACFRLDPGRFFPETGKSISGRFLDFWQANGGVAVFGYPVSEQQQVDGRTVQQFERQRFELHPEQTGTPYDVLLGRLGVEAAQQRGLLGSAPFKPVGTASSNQCLYFQETGHQICGGFRAYWQGHGLDLGDPDVSQRESLALFGYPISEEFTDPQTGRVTQYFERAVFEWAPQNQPPWDILLQRLGADASGK